MILQAGGKRLGVVEHLLLVGLEGGLRRLLQRAGQPRDGVVVGATLKREERAHLNSMAGFWAGHTTIMGKLPGKANTMSWPQIGYK